MLAKKRPVNGRSKSKTTGPRLDREPTAPSPELQRLLAAAYHRYQKLDDPAADAAACRDFVFHMTDWIDDLEQLAKVYASPGKQERKSAERIVYQFLNHAVSHLMAAGVLIDGKLSDPFGVVKAK